MCFEVISYIIIYGWFVLFYLFILINLFQSITKVSKLSMFFIDAIYVKFYYGIKIIPNLY